MSNFQEIAGTVVLNSKGVYQETSLASLDNVVYAKTDRGYIRLKKHGATTVSNIFWGPISWVSEPVFEQSTGNMIVSLKPALQILVA